MNLFMQLAMNWLLHATASLTTNFNGKIAEFFGKVQNQARNIRFYIYFQSLYVVQS